ncbi:hypothetical protein [Shimia sp.]|uniref:hypothetical protein n=1 Tax=Shimia sp. TaxID=1954381 RepID=UPI0035641540
MSSTSDMPREKTITPERISELAELHFAEPVVRITAPGGKKRDSVRVHFRDRSVIASYRYRPSRLQREILVLEKLHGAGAPVPEYLGRQGALLFQSDVGSGRLSSQMHGRDHAGQVALARAAFDSLWTIKRAAKETGLTEQVPEVGVTSVFVARFATCAQRIGRGLDLALPAVDWGGISRAVVPVPRHFVKWDARSGNAALRGDGTLSWFDWEHAGRRMGVEDFGFLIADEFWPLSPEDSLEAFAATCPGRAEALLPHLIRFSALQAIERIRLIQNEVFKRGWTDFRRAQRYDRMGAAPELLRSVARHGDALARLDPLTAPLSGWCSQAAEALIAWQPERPERPEKADQAPASNAP